MNKYIYLANQAPKRMFLIFIFGEKKINSEATYVCVKANLLSKDRKRNGYKIICKFLLLKRLRYRYSN